MLAMREKTESFAIGLPVGRFALIARRSDKAFCSAMLALNSERLRVFCMLHLV